MRSFLELLEQNISDRYIISHNALDGLEKNKYYVKRTDNIDKILFIFDQDINGRYMKIVQYIGQNEYGSLAIYDLSENNLIDNIRQYCS